MSDKKVIKPVALAVGAALAGSFAFTGMATADTVDNPFEMSSLTAGYLLGAEEGSCGGDKESAPEVEKDAEGSCGEGSCGADTEPEKDAEGSCGESDAPEVEKDAEGSCGEGSCGADTEVQ